VGAYQGVFNGSDFAVQADTQFTVSLLVWGDAYGRTITMTAWLYDQTTNTTIAQYDIPKYNVTGTDCSTAGTLQATFHSPASGSPMVVHAHDEIYLQLTDTNGADDNICSGSGSFIIGFPAPEGSSSSTISVSTTTTPPGSFPSWTWVLFVVGVLIVIFLLLLLYRRRNREQKHAEAVSSSGLERPGPP
jgi:hypothetical protein